MLMQNFGATIKKHYGMLWYFLEWPIALSTLPSLPRVNAYTANEEVEILLFYHKKRHMGVV